MAHHLLRSADIQDPHLLAIQCAYLSASDSDNNTYGRAVSAIEKHITCMYVTVCVNDIFRAGYSNDL